MIKKVLVFVDDTVGNKTVLNKTKIKKVLHFNY
jgi:hypothetical protein